MPSASFPGTMYKLYAISMHILNDYNAAGSTKAYLKLILYIVHPSN